MKEKIEDLSTAHWVVINNFINEKGDLLEFKEHFFLLAILEDTSDTIVVKKCSQVGVSVMMTLKAYFAADQGRMNVIYTMPSDNDVSEFVKTKVDMIFQSNEKLREKVSSDTVGLKQSGERFIDYRGKRATSHLSVRGRLLVCQ